MPQKDITIIIPTYKPQEYIVRCVDSIAAQTLDHSRFNVIIVLNGCDAPYMGMLENVCKQHEGTLDIKLVQTDTPGVSNARNIALDMVINDAPDTMSSRYICFIDDDDRVSDNYLENLLAAADDGTVMPVSNVKTYGENSHRYGENYLTRAFRRERNNPRSTLLTCRSFYSSPCCKLIPTAAIGGVRFDRKVKRGEDSLFMAAISKNISRVTFAKEDTYYFVTIRGNSASRKPLPFSQRAKETMYNGFSFIRIYLSDICHYNALFFATRLAAITIGLFVKEKDNFE